MDRKLDSLAIVVPCYNEEDVLHLFYETVKQILVDSNVDVNIIFVDDGSKDRTLLLLNELASQDASLSVISLARNFGHQIALTAGLDFAQADAIVTMDADLQHPPETISAMVEAYNNGYDVVYGVRQEDINRSWVKRLVAQLYYSLLRQTANIEILEGAVDFRLMSREVVQVLTQMRETHRYLRGMVPWIGFSHTIVEYKQAVRAAGVPKYTWRKLWTLARSGLFSFTTFPLDMITYLGLGLTALSGVYFAFVILAAIFSDVGQAIPGWLSQTILLLMLGGVQLISLGVIAQYIGMIFEQVKDRPLYTIKQVRLAQDVAQAKNTMTDLEEQHELT